MTLENSLWVFSGKTQSEWRKSPGGWNRISHDSLAPVKSSAMTPSEAAGDIVIHAYNSYWRIWNLKTREHELFDPIRREVNRRYDRGDPALWKLNCSFDFYFQKRGPSSLIVEESSWLIDDPLNTLKPMVRRDEMFIETQHPFFTVAVSKHDPDSYNLDPTCLVSDVKGDQALRKYASDFIHPGPMSLIGRYLSAYRPTIGAVLDGLVQASIKTDYRLKLKPNLDGDGTRFRVRVRCRFADSGHLHFMITLDDRDVSFANQARCCIG